MKSEVSLTIEDTRPIRIQSQDYKPTRDQYLITLVDELITGETYKLYVPFSKKEFVNFSDRGYIQYDYTEVPHEPKK